eukprot:TRINITY_DN5367_c0_g1_i1.p1 TRINITY_DN5367_c0_g1~~TRINITY_DN5367_c0_g1_i1.p1  ORF type:complete len:399 (-),score=99.11 TRINITY_DN5367_c0_g1_i1:525-1679(-)
MYARTLDTCRDNLRAALLEKDESKSANAVLMDEKQMLLRRIDDLTKLKKSAEGDLMSEKVIAVARDAVAKCGKVKLDLSSVRRVGDGLCQATDEELVKYNAFTPRADCPNDWPFVQKLIFERNCFSLPRRRCFARGPKHKYDPLPLPQSLWDQRALNSSFVRWDQHSCGNFECLNARTAGDCRNCFNLTLESSRWKSSYRGSIRMADVIALKKGTLRIGLDAGAGSGSFAARMAEYNVTVMSTAMNIETLPPWAIAKGENAGLPYMETIALRGLIPLHVPHRARLPFFDNTLDVVHAVNSIKYLELPEFEELLFEWNRILRPGGVIWLELFYAPVTEMPLYIGVIDLLGYQRLYWKITEKIDIAEREGQHVYLNALLEKPARNV